LVVVRKGKAYSLTSPVSLDHEGNLMDVTNSEVVAFPTLPPREGRVSVTLEDGTTLNVDRNEVTRRAWKQCVEAGPCRVISQDSCGKKRFYGDSNDSLRQVRTQSWRSLDPMPVTCILHEDAETFCRWSSGRLPTAEEYQRLVQVALKTSKTPSDQYWPINTLGIDRISNPWQPGGDDPFADLAPSGSLRPLNPGIYDLGGNADELCTSSGRAVGNTPYEFTCRTPNQIGSSSRALKSNQGFRCVDK
jgi:formylglycine-generating enzyme required for sulfatase activity